MKKKRMFPSRYVILIVLTVIAIVLAVIFSVVKSEKNLNPIEKLMKDTGLFIQKVFSSPVAFVLDKMDEHDRKKEMYATFTELEKMRDEYELNLARQAELEKENRELKNALDLGKSLSEYSFLNATVINRNLGYWFNTITIDKGEHNGVKVDMPVIVREGLIGRVIRTTNFSSTIKLLTTDDVNNKISVKVAVEDRFVYGLLSGYDVESNTFTVEGIGEYTEIPVGSKVTTTGLGNLFPSGILLGEVVAITHDNFDLAKTVAVKSFADFNDLSFVTLLNREAIADGQ